MAALQPSVGGQPATTIDFSQKSFAKAVLTSHAPTAVSDSHALTALAGLHRGLPSIEFTDAHMDSLSNGFSWTLVAKFSKGYNRKDPKLGRPSVDDLHKYFVAMDFKQPFTLGLLDNRHALIKFQCEEDYIRLYSRSVWHVGAVTMRIFKWSPYFRVDKESSIVPIWITFPGLPVHFFQKEALFPISQLIGQPLRMDTATATLKRPSVARVQVEIDILQPKTEKIWIQMGSKEGYWQKVEYENVPSYCSHCWHVGHSEDVCTIHHPELRAIPQASNFNPAPRLPSAPPGKPGTKLQVYVPKSNGKDPAPPNLSQPLEIDKASTSNPQPNAQPPVQETTVVPQPNVQPPAQPNVQGTTIVPPPNVQPPVQSASLERAETSSVDEEIEILDEVQVSDSTSCPIPRSVDDIALYCRVPRPSVLVTLTAEQSIRHGTTREEIFAQLRNFEQELKTWSSVEVEATAADLTQPAKRGRPRKKQTLLDSLTQPPSTHQMVTRSQVSSPILND